MLSVPKIKLSFAIAASVLSFTQVQAKPVKSLPLEQSPTSNLKAQLNRTLIFAAPPPPPDIGEPGRRADAGSRGCGGNKRLIALVPDYLNSHLIFGATTAQYPTFWFYIPYQPAFPAKFVLEEKDGKLVYQSDLKLSQTPGVINLSVPKTVAPLSMGKQYHWYLNIYCKQQDPPIFVEGWIQRNSLNPTVQDQLDKATPRDRVALYAANGIWFEALSTAGELRRRDPNDTSWATLLQTVGLNGVANEPIVPCCTLR